MTARSVWAAALALREFTEGQLTAFCDEELPAVRARLREESGDLVEQLPDGVGGPGQGQARWRVRDPDALRGLLGVRREPGGAHRGALATSNRRREDQLVDARLLRAEDTLLECALEESPAVRKTMAATSLTYLRQYVAARLPRGSDWWDVDVDAFTVDDPGRSSERLDSSRVRVDAALARLTESEAAGDRASWELVLRAARDMGRLSGSLGEQRLRPMLTRFLDLVEEAAPATGAAHGSAPGRMLTTVAWERVRDKVDDSAEAASRELFPVLSWMEACEGSPDEGKLYRVRARLPDGRARITVYADLIPLLPRQFSLHPKREVVPGALVDAVADVESAEHLETCADRLCRGLLDLPFESPSALIGQAVHVIAELAEASARIDGGVASRAERARADLLTLVDVPVDRPASVPSDRLAGVGRGAGR